MYVVEVNHYCDCEEMADLYSLLGARRLLTYRRIPDNEVNQEALRLRKRREDIEARTADESNAFRRKVHLSNFFLTTCVHR